jgi:hypothetical protein
LPRKTPLGRRFGALFLASFARKPALSEVEVGICIAKFARSDSRSLPYFDKRTILRTRREFNVGAYGEEE